MKRYLYIVFLLLVLTSTHSWAQTNMYRFQHLTGDDGLTQNSVNTIVQDQYGFMWFGTNNGLNKYDGYTVETFFNDKNDSLSLSNNQIISLCSDSKGRLWIGTNGGGINLFNREKSIFTRLVFSDSQPQSLSSNDVTVIFEDPEGNIWVGTKKGLNKFDESTGTFIRYTNSSNTANCLVNNFITTIHAVNPGYLWVGTHGGLNKFYYNTGNFEAFTTHTPNGLNDNNVSVIYEDTLGLVWIGTEKGAMNVYNQTSNTWNYYGYEKDALVSSYDNSISAINKGINGDMWIGTPGGGIYQLNHGKDRFFREYRNAFGLNETLANNLITCIYKSEADVLWIGMLDGGVDRIDLRQQPIYRMNHIPNTNNTLCSRRANGILSDSDGNFWVATGKGLNLRKQGEETFNCFVEEPGTKNSINDNRCYSLLEANNQEIWIGTYFGGVNIYNKSTGKFSYLLHSDADTNTIPSNFVRALYKDATGQIWVGTVYGGLSRYHAQTNSFSNYIFPGPAGNTSEFNNVMSIIGDAGNNLYVATFGDGVIIVDKSTKNIVEKTRLTTESGLSSNHATNICFDSDSLLWIGTADGLNSYNPITRQLVNYSKKDGLPDNFIRALVEGNDKRIWISTNNGISAFNKTNSWFSNYIREDGLQDHEFNYCAVAKDKNGIIYFGGSTGISYFNPMQVLTHQHELKVRFTGLYVNNNEVKIGQKLNNQVLLTEPIYKAKKIHISYRNGFVALRFSAMDYIQTGKIYYRYKLGATDSYVNLQNSNTISFHNLIPGTYTLYVGASTSQFTEEQSPDNEARLTIIVDGPLWKKPAFQVLLWIVIVIIIIVFYRLRINAIRRQKRELEKQVYERTQELHETNVLLEENQTELEMQQEELITQRDLANDQSERIREQNRELELHHENLEKLIGVRTEELYQAKIKAEQADALKTSFLANMSHEIRTPMNAILGFLELLDDPDFSADERTMFKSLMNKSGASLLNLINDIIDIAKIESGQINMFSIDFDLATMFNELHLQYSKILADEKSDIKLIMNDIKPCALYYDDLRIRQVLQNLLNNALKFTDTGTISMGYSIRQSYVLAFVTDTGIGIKKEFLTNIFERFHKLDENNGKIYRGTGLGLAISKNIIELIGGEIWVESEPNVGSTFWFTIPLKEKSTKG